MENPNLWSRQSRSAKAAVFGVTFAVLVGGALLGVNLLNGETIDPEHPVECTTDDIGCTLQRLLFDLIPLLIFTTGELVDLDNSDRAPKPDPRAGKFPNGTTNANDTE